MSFVYNTGRGVEIGFDSANTSYIDLHSYDFLNADYDARIICGGSYGNDNSGGGSININTLNLLWNSNSLATQSFVNSNYMTLNGGTSNSANILNTPTYLNYTRIA